MSNVRALHLLEVGLSWPLESYLQRKLEGLATRGMRITVAGHLDRHAPRPHLPGIKLIRLPDWDEPRIRMILGSIRDGLAVALKRPRKLIELLRSVRKTRLIRAALPLLLADADVVHFEWDSTARSFLQLFELLEVPVVVSSHGGINVRPRIGDERMASSYALIFKKATATHCVCEAIFRTAVAYGLDPLKAKIIRTAVDTEFFSPAARAPGPNLRIVAVGELNFIKGYDVAIEAISYLVSQGVPASLNVIGGEPPSANYKNSERSRLMYLINESGLQDRVHLLGQLDQEQVRDHLRRSDVLLHPSLSEGLPNAVLEAMACALPVVVTDCGGLSEAVRDGIDGFICPRQSPKALAEALNKLWDDPVKARAMGEAGRARVVSDFALSHQLDEFAGFYESLVRSIKR